MASLQKSDRDKSRYVANEKVSGRLVAVVESGDEGQCAPLGYSVV